MGIVVVEHVHEVDSTKQLQTPDTKGALTIIDDVDRFKYTHSILLPCLALKKMAR